MIAAFYSPEFNNSRVFGLLNAVDIMMNAIFGLNIIVTFFSSYYDDDYHLVVRHQVIAMEYLTTWFLFDLVSIIPFELIAS